MLLEKKKNGEFDSLVFIIFCLGFNENGSKSSRMV